MGSSTVIKAIVLNDDGQVLLMRRADDDLRRPGDWDFPGGSVDPGEDIFEAGARELGEEAGIQIDPTDLSLIFAHTEVSGDWNRNRLLVVCKVVQSSVIRLSHEHSEFVWVSVDEALEQFPHHVWGVGLRHARDNHLLPS